MARKTAVEDLRDLLRRQIVEEMRAGAFLPNERVLAKRFAVSRNTVRETLIHLEALALIEKTPRGARVRKPNFDPAFSVFGQYFDRSPRTMVDVLEFRRIVELGAAPLSAAGATEATLRRMTQANAAMAAALTTSEAASSDFDFHNALIEASGNEVVIRMYRVLSVPLKYFFEVGKTQLSASEQACAEHVRIIEALRHGEPNAVVAALEAHFDHSAAVFAQVMERITHNEPRVA